MDTFDSFIVLPSNRQARDAARGWAAQRQSPRAVCLAGPTGTGKTHLVRAALAHTAADRGWRCMRSLSAEQMLDDHLAALRRGEPTSVLGRPHPDLLLIEHLEDLERKPCSLALVAERLAFSRARLLLTATCPGPGSLPRLESALGRLGARLVFTRRLPRWERGHLAARLARRAGLAELPPVWWHHCSNAAEILGEIRCRAHVRAACVL